ncbi:MAG: beta-galactosidase, partial [Gemmatimonadales bacterium]|nr:beta-galactosidase [Gemmatimonadales bacterium]
PLTLTIERPRAWSPDDPYLYDIEVSLASGDSVRSYFGMRDVAVGPDSAGAVRLLLNGRPLFQYGLLDQGWWPDGLYTAPTEAALRYDLEVTRRLGFNMIRKHVKVEPERWYFLADSLGLLVWQDMPSGKNEGGEAQAEFERELVGMVHARANHPSIVMWVPFNEGWGQHDTERYVALLHELDPSRPVNNASGWTDRDVGEISDVHHYPGPGMPEPDGRRVLVLGEFGGLGLPLPGHTWVAEGNWGYRGFQTLEDLRAAYRSLIRQLRPLIGEGLAAAVYTQTTDVEIEVNGIMTYDRSVVKLPDDIVADHRALFGPPPMVRTVVPTSRTAAQRWHYTTARPAAGWQQPPFDDSAWMEGPGGFGTERTPGAHVRTVWDTSDLWLRRTFRLESAVPAAPQLRIHHDEDAEVYLNGVLVASLEGYTSGYVLIPLDAAGRAALRQGVNTLAVHVRQTDGGRYIDVGLVEVVEP